MTSKKEIIDDWILFAGTREKWLTFTFSAAQTCCQLDTFTRQRLI